MNVTKFSATFEASHIPDVHICGRALVRRLEDGAEVDRGYFEFHRLDAQSPTGVVRIVELLGGKLREEE